MMPPSPDGIGKCALTFDDGPDPSWTPAVLDGLREADARATFFPIGSLAADHPELIGQMLERGHEVGLHCMRHIRHTALSPAALDADTEAAWRVLTDLSATPTCWRPPWGVQTAATRRIAAERKLELVRWTADTHDWRGDSAASMHAAVEPLMASGALVLMHDGIGPGARREHCAETVELTRMLIKTLRQRGLAPATVSELRR